MMLLFLCVGGCAESSAALCIFREVTPQQREILETAKSRKGSNAVRFYPKPNPRNHDYFRPIPAWRCAANQRRFNSFRFILGATEIQEAMLREYQEPRPHSDAAPVLIAVRGQKPSRGSCARVLSTTQDVKPGPGRADFQPILCAVLD
jgi:hypothetical protein